MYINDLTGDHFGCEKRSLKNLPGAPPASLTEHAYSEIRDRILEGTLSFGAPVSRRELAAELGMSLLPVAAAIQRLEAEALIETVARVGTRVKVPSAQDVRGFCAVREAPNMIVSSVDLKSSVTTALPVAP